MAKFKASPTTSFATGYYMACPMNALRNPIKHKTPLALPVFRGPKKAFIKCSCGYAAFLPSDWTDATGLSEEEARRMGLLVLTSFAPPKKG